MGWSLDLQSNPQALIFIGLTFSHLIQSSLLISLSRLNKQFCRFGGLASKFILSFFFSKSLILQCSGQENQICLSILLSSAHQLEARKYRNIWPSQRTQLQSCRFGRREQHLHPFRSKSGTFRNALSSLHSIEAFELQDYLHD